MYVYGGGRVSNNTVLLFRVFHVPAYSIRYSLPSKLDHRRPVKQAPIRYPVRDDFTRQIRGRPTSAWSNGSSTDETVRYQ